MPAVDSDQLCESIHDLKEAAVEALNNESVEDFENVERSLAEINGYLRELHQAQWSDQARTTLRRLEKNEHLAESDHDVIRAFLIADAESYIAHENNFHDWTKELKRLLDSCETRARQGDPESVLAMRGMIKDAVRLVPDIRNYLDEKRRVEKFDRSFASMDGSTREMLHRLLKEQLRSPRR